MFRVEKSSYFRREGADVHTDADISLSQAILGGTIRIQGVYETQTIQILPGTSSHTKVCLSNKGMKRVNSYGNGDHYVHVKIAIPKSLTAEQKALIQVSVRNPIRVKSSFNNNEKVVNLTIALKVAFSKISEELSIEISD